MAETVAQLRARLESAAGGGPTKGPLTVIELVERFLAWASRTYDKREHEPNNGVQNARDAARGLLLLYADSPAKSFGAKQLGAIREWLIEQGHACRTINDRLMWIRRIFGWGCGEGYIKPQQLSELMMVKRVDARQARQTLPVEMVDEETVNATLEHCVPAVKAMVKLQLLTGMRPGEVVRLQGKQINRTQKDLWIYMPPKHKNSHRGHGRRVNIGPQGILLLQPFLSDSFLFLSRLGKPYTVNSYSTAVRRASEKVGKHWSPNQLRHTAGTRAYERDGRDAAQDVLGHRDPRSTNVYITPSQTHAVAYVRRWG